MQKILTYAKCPYRQFPLVISWLYYLAATEEMNWTSVDNIWIAAKQIEYISTGANQGKPVITRNNQGNQG